MRRFISFFLFFLVCLASPLALEQVGKIIAIYGEVQIDIQGKEKFIKSLIGDVLYSSTIIKTGKSSLVTISVYGKTIDLPSSSLISISDILHASTLKASLDNNIYTEIIKLLEDILINHLAQVEKQEKGTVETKAGNRQNNDFSTFITDGMIDNELFQNGKKVLMKKDYHNALSLLTAMSNPPFSQAEEFEYCLLTAYCYLFMDNYRQAKEFFIKTGKLTDTGTGDTYYKQEVLFKLPLGIVSYLMENNTDAISYFKHCLELEGNTALLPYNYYLLSHALFRTGQTAEAKKYLDEAAKRFKDSLLGKAWTRLSTKLH